ncbi:MAG TPA: hypothetical protein VF607_02850 [Verrucomicrobiae bacterium]
MRRMRGGKYKKQNDIPVRERIFPENCVDKTVFIYKPRACEKPQTFSWDVLLSPKHPVFHTPAGCSRRVYRKSQALGGLCPR